jgi:hypothetical protein
MKKEVEKKVIMLHLSKWTRPYLYAKEINVSKQVVNNWIKRKQINTRVIEELDNLILVARGSEMKKKKSGKKNING